MHSQSTTPNAVLIKSCIRRLVTFRLNVASQGSCARRPRRSEPRLPQQLLQSLETFIQPRSQGGEGHVNLMGVLRKPYERLYLILPVI